MLLQILATQQKLDEVKDVMVASVELVLERGERLELLVDKTDNLQQQVLVHVARRHARFSGLWLETFAVHIFSPGGHARLPAPNQPFCAVALLCGCFVSRDKMFLLHPVFS